MNRPRLHWPEWAMLAALAILFALSLREWAAFLGIAAR